jgi:hypothetical protein
MAEIRVKMRRKKERGEGDITTNFPEGKGLYK